MVDLTSPKQGPLEHGFNNMVFVVAGILVFSVIGIFGYRLYQSLYEKERKREEKRKQKELKKKK